MTIKVKIVVGVAVITAFSVAPGFAVRAEDFTTAIYRGVTELRQACGVIRDDPRLAEAAQRHANDMVNNGVGGGHTGSDGSTPAARIADTVGARTGQTGEIIYWGTGSRATPRAALDWWMQSPVHRAVILNCALTAVGFAIAWDANKMVVVGDFAGR